MTSLSNSKEPVFLFSDMDMGDMASDMDFSKNWMLALAMILKKEQPIHIIHNLNRPFHELMLGLEAYIPLYMTGLFSPYYLDGTHNKVFRHFLDVSDTCALSGEAISGHHKQGIFYLTNNADELAYFQERAKLLLKKATPLMDIYTTANTAQYEQFLKTTSFEKTNRHLVSSALPVFTLPPEKLEKILDASDMIKDNRDAFLREAEKERDNINSLLLSCQILEELPLVNKEEFAQHPLKLYLPNSFLPAVPYSYEEYLEHLEYTKGFAEKNPSYQIRYCPDFMFRNIRIHIAEGKWIWISKAASPAIHFIIYQKQLREAIERMCKYPPSNPLQG